MLVQNYSDLTLKDMILRDGGADTYILSNNFGTVHLQGTTEIHANPGHVAFDLWYGMANDGSYDDGVTVFIDDPTVVIDGPVEFGHARRITDEAQFLANTHLYVCEGFDRDGLEVRLTNPTKYSGYTWELAENGYYELKPIAK